MIYLRITERKLHENGVNLAPAELGDNLVKESGGTAGILLRVDISQGV